MNPPRRTLEAALQTPDLPQAALDIIKEGTPRSQTPVAITTAPDKPKDQAAPKAAREPVDQTKPRVQKERGAETVSFTPMTVRVPAKIPEALLRAASERKLKRLRPYTQQDIIAEALQEWLQKNGFMPKQG